MKKLIIATIVAIGVTGGIHAKIAQVKQSESKDIQVVSSSHDSSSSETIFDTKKGNLFKFAKPVSKRVKVGEHIRISFKLKKKAYVYMIAISEKNNKAYMILPNKIEKHNRYRAGVHYVVPERSAKFRFASDRPGVETIYLIASAHKQNFEQLLDSFGEKTTVGFRITTASKAQTFMKDIIITPAVKKKKKIEVRKIKIKVYDDSAVQANSSARVFLTTGKLNYKKGEIVKTLLSSNQSGYVSIFIQNPDKSFDYLTTKKVKKNKIYYIKMKTQKDNGRHDIIAFFSNKKPKNPQGMMKTAKGTTSKDITIVSSKPKNTPVNIHSIVVK